MKRPIRLILSVIAVAFLSLSLFLLLPLTGCRKEEAEDGTGAVESEVLPDTPSAPPSCTIVRSDTSDKAVTDAAVALRHLLEEAGIEADIKTDWVKRGEEITRFPNEILIGPTNRPESEEIYEKLAEAETPYDYLITVGSVNRIAAPNETIRDAAFVFAREYAAWIRYCMPSL